MLRPGWCITSRLLSFSISGRSDGRGKPMSVHSPAFSFAKRTVGSGTAATSANKYRDANVIPEQAAREMGVRYVLQGTVRRAGERIRITLELTDVAVRQII